MGVLTGRTVNEMNRKWLKNRMAFKLFFLGCLNCDDEFIPWFLLSCVTSLYLYGSLVFCFCAIFPPLGYRAGK